MDRILKQVFFFLLFVHVLHASDSITYQSPVDHQIRLTGNFMEIRNNHFHSGIDIKSSAGRTGDLIRSVHDGYVSRIKIQSGSYGNALYIDHPVTGHTSLYAHLDSYSDEIAQYVKFLQYKYQRFEIDIYLPPGKFMVAQGDVIGTMGNSGRSFGPHLHFELRDTRTEEPINPELLGLGPTDSRAPVIQSLHVYHLGDELEMISDDIRYFNQNKPGFQLYKDEVIAQSRYIAFGLQMFDLMDGSSNKNGIHGYKVFENDSLIFSWQAERFSFDENRFLNAFIDYSKRKIYGQKIYLLYRQSCNPFSHYRDFGSGIIEVKKDRRQDIRIEVFDLFGNNSDVHFTLRKAEDELVPDQNPALCDTLTELKAGIFNVSFSKNTFFSPQQIYARSIKDVVENQECMTLELGSSSVPVSTYYKISIGNYPELDAKIWTMVSKDDKGRLIHFGLEKENGKFVSYIDQLGKFSLFKDIVPPDIEPLSMSLSQSSAWRFRIKDNLIPDGKVDDLEFKAEAGGQWLLMKYDKKNDMLIFNDFEKLPQKPFEFRLVVTDHCGNSDEYIRMIK
ncbi:MAG: M23 family metallopeptidase [Bacteroidia bacterium]|nr:M23 family metallopeptidase [Bacteroidia bacterium]